MKVCLIHSPDYWSEWFENSIPKQINLRDPWKPPQTLNTIEWVHSIFFLTILATVLAMHWVPRLTKSFWFHEILHKTRYHIHNHSVWCKDNNFYDKSSFLNHERRVLNRVCSLSSRSINWKAKFTVFSLDLKCYVK